MTKLFIATPAFSGQVLVQYAIALSETCTLLNALSIQTMLRLNSSGSLLVAERNRLLKAFLETDCTHILCVDSDLGWPAQALPSMINKEREIICGLYPSRREDTYLFRPCYKDDKSIFQEDGLLKMEYVPAGFMLMKRHVIVKMNQTFPELYTEPKDPKNKDANFYCLFNTELYEGEFWGEDYVFCRRARQAGFDIWVDPMIEFDHHGVRGMFAQVLTNNKEDSIKKVEIPENI